MDDDDDLKFLARQFERVARDLQALRDDLGVLALIIMRQVEFLERKPTKRKPKGKSS